MEHASLPFLDLTAPGFSTRSEEVTRARDAHWCARTPHGYAVLRHRQAGKVLRDRRLRQGSHAWPEMVKLRGSFADFWHRSVISLEGEAHVAIRRLSQDALAEKDILTLEPDFARAAEAPADDLAASDSFDLIDGFSEPFAGRAIALLLGEPAEEAAAIGRDASRLGLVMGPDARRYEAEANAAVERLMERAARLIDTPPPGSLVARLMSPGFADRQAQIDLVAIAIFGGVDTTRAQLGFAALLFARHPDRWTWLRARREAVPAAIDEVIRLHPTTTWATREARDDPAIDGVRFSRGDIVHVLVHASATDPATGHDGQFDIRARRKPHFGFGGGAHH